MDHLIALPIKGKSFLLKRGSIHVLVDGGGSIRNVPKSGLALAQALNAEFPSLRFIDVVVCTHADGDHAAGLASLLDHWRVRGVNAEEEHGRVGQFWLPGRWADVLPELMREPRVFVNGLIKELDEIVRDQPELAQSQNADDQLKKQLDALVCPGSDQKTSDEWCPPSRSGPSRDDEVVDKDVDLGSAEPLNEPHWFRQLRDIVAPEKVHDEAIRRFDLPVVESNIGAGKERSPIRLSGSGSNLSILPKVSAGSPTKPSNITSVYAGLILMNFGAHASRAAEFLTFWCRSTQLNKRSNQELGSDICLHSRRSTRNASRSLRPQLANISVFCFAVIRP